MTNNLGATRASGAQAQMHTVVLRAITHEQPRSSLDEVTGELFRRTGTKACTVTVRKALREAGIERLNPCARAGERAAGVHGTAPAKLCSEVGPPQASSVGLSRRNVAG